MITDFMSKFPLRAFLFISGLAVFGSLLYYALPVTRLGLVIAAILAGILAAVVPLPPPSKYPASRRPSVMYALAGIVMVALAAWWSTIIPIQITDAVRSPWGIVPQSILAALALGLFALFALLTRKPDRLTVLLTIATFFSAIALAVTVYTLGYGFDPFLHRATVAHIAEFGTITPKPLYYIGQYALELPLHKLFALPLSVVDHYLVPVLAAVMLTMSTLYGLVRLHRQKTSLALAVLFLFPLGTVIATTPQGLAYVFCASALMLCAGRLSDQTWSRIPALALTIAACFTHPFAGIPTLIFIVGYFVLTTFTSSGVRTAALVVSTLANAAAIPALFAVQAAQSGLALPFHPSNLFDLERWRTLAVSGFFSNHFSFVYDLLYLALDNMLIIVIVLAGIGLVAVLRHPHTGPEKHIAQLFAYSALAMMINFIVLSIVFDFDFLISYERSDYALRALTMAQLFLLPLAGIGLATSDLWLRHKPQVLRSCFLGLLTIIAIGNVYGAYPRHDNYARSAGFNVSQADFDAVDAIDDRAAGAEYVVLANQATAAAAVETYGFKTYYHGDIFYYPIPTGGALYEKYLAMVNDGPSQATIEATMDLTGANLVFFAVSDYWWQSGKIIENAKRLTDEWFAVDEGKVTVFIFRR